MEKQRSIVFSEHFLERCWNRYVNPNEIRKILLTIDVNFNDEIQLCFHPKFLASFGIKCRESQCIVVVVKRRRVITCYSRNQQLCIKNKRLTHLN
jgi:hypothetical protein